jgi:hypothetical protein
VTIVGLPGGLDGILTLRKFATSAYQTRGHVVSVRLHAVSAAGPGGASIVVPESSNSIKQAVYAFTHPQLLIKPTGLPSAPTRTHHKKHQFTPTVSPASVQVSVLNGTTTTGEAASTATALGTFGYPTSSGNAPTQAYRQTWIYYRPGFARAAADLKKIMGTGQVGPLPAAISASSASVVVVIGTDFSGRLAIKARKAVPTSRYPPTITPDSQVYLADFKSAAARPRMRGFPGLYPTVTQSSSQLRDDVTPGPVRTYTIPFQRHHWASMYAEFQLTTTVGGYWGIEETRFTQAPIIQNPQAVRTLDGRKYMFFLNGQHIHMIAFIQHGAAYWVVNTLLDELTNQEMIAIARSLKPTG